MIPRRCRKDRGITVLDQKRRSSQSEPETVSAETETQPRQRANGGLSHHIRISLHPRSICIGETGFLGPETDRPKSPSGQKPSPRRPKRSRNSPPMAGSLAVSGKTAGSKDCVVGPGEVPAASNVKGLRPGAGVSGPLMRKRKIRRCPHRRARGTKKKERDCAPSSRGCARPSRGSPDEVKAQARTPPMAARVAARGTVASSSTTVKSTSLR